MREADRVCDMREEACEIAKGILKVAVGSVVMTDQGDSMVCVSYLVCVVR